MDNPPMSSPAPRSGPFAALGNAFYLGTSWTWVIGMLFPALILRDYGLWGFVAFAVPNVVGAAAMGFVLTPERAKGILEKHKTACAWFSVTTMAFHLFVAVWLLPTLFNNWGFGLVVLTAGVCLVAHKIAGTKGVWIASALVWILSMVMFSKGVNTEGAWTGASWEMGRLGKDGLLAFVPASVLGFALCPYLDLTFLKARAETDKNTGRVAFSLGFGVVFCAMIFFTVCYGGQLWGVFIGESNAHLAPAWKGILMAHLPAQIGLTMALHGMEVSPNTRPSPLKALGSTSSNLAGFVFVLALLAGLAMLIGRNIERLDSPEEVLMRLARDAAVRDGGMAAAESIYRSFLLLYGTVLPAYVLLKMIPSRKPVSQRVRTWSFVGAALTSYPLAWGAFVLHHHWMILPCAGALTIAFLVAQFGPAKKDGEAPADAPALKPEA